MALQFDSATSSIMKIEDSKEQEVYTLLVDIWENGGQISLDSATLGRFESFEQKDLLIGTYRAFTSDRSSALPHLLKFIEQVRNDDPFSQLAYLAILNLYSRIILSGDNYEKYIADFFELGNSISHLSWFHLHRLIYMEKSLDINDDWSEWTSCYQEAKAHFENIEIGKELQAHFLTREAIYLKALGKYDLAIQAFETSNKYCGELTFLRHVKFLNQLDLAALAFRRNEQDQAKYYMDQAKISWDHSDPILSELNYYSILAHNYYAPAKEWELAYHALDSLLGANLQFFFEANNIRMVEMSQAFEAEKKDTEIASQKSQIEDRNRLLLVALSSVVILLVLSIALLMARNAINKQNAKIELLLRELHHRVKNNLQVISSLLGLQAIKLKDENARMAVSESKNRIATMSLIHQKLYQNERVTGLNISEYLVGLVEELINTYGFKNKISLDIDVLDEPLDTDTALSVGLIINELVSNVFKYAFKEHENPELQIKLIKVEGNVHVLIIKDNGVGFPLDFDLDNSPSFGIKLVHLLVQQLKGSFKLSNEEGAQWTINFKSSKALG